MPGPSCIVRITSDARGSGKTLLAAGITETLAREGLSIVALKHVHHGGPDLLEGKDAERIFASGALLSIAYGREHSLVIVRNPPDPLKLAEAIAGALGLEGYILLVEGLHDYELPQDTTLVDVRLSPGRGVYTISGSPCRYESRGLYEATPEGVQSLIGDLLHAIKQCCLGGVHT